jgi:alpha-tubulin suppressor-like RCC1 family protein
VGPGGTGFLTGFKAIAGGGPHSIALKNDGTVWTWGDNNAGQLGDGTTLGTFVPVQVVGPGGSGYLNGIAMVAGGDWHTIALKNDGTVWTWGYNNYGELGDGTTASSSTPVQVKGPGGSGFLTGITAIAGGYLHTIALKDDGTVWTWGYNGYGELGNGTTTDSSVPIQVVGQGGLGYLAGIVAIGGGSSHTVALKNDGTVWTWGDNNYGELGDGTTTNRSAPVRVVGQGGSGFLSGITAISSGEFHIIALKDDGTVWTWGRNEYGQLGDGTTTSTSTPVHVIAPGGLENLSNVKAVSGGRWHTVILKNDATVWTWGFNFQGELGDGTMNDSYLPVQVLGPQGVGHLTGVATITTTKGWANLILR